MTSALTLLDDFLKREGCRILNAHQLADHFPAARGHLMAMREHEQWAVLRKKPKQGRGDQEVALFGDLPACERDEIVAQGRDRSSVVLEAIKKTRPDMKVDQGADMLRTHDNVNDDGRFGNVSLVGNGQFCVACYAMGAGREMIILLDILTMKETKMWSLCPDCDGTGRKAGPPSQSRIIRTRTGPSWRERAQSILRHNPFLVTQHVFGELLRESRKSYPGIWWQAAIACGWEINVGGHLTHPHKSGRYHFDNAKGAVLSSGYATPEEAFLANGFDEDGYKIKPRQLP